MSIARLKEEFYKASKYRSAGSLTVGNLPRFPAFILVIVISRFPFIKPEHLVLVGFASNVLASFMLIFYPAFAVQSALLFLFYIILDNADGQLARYTMRVSAVGGLMDIVGDFIGLILLYTFITIHILPANSCWLLLLISAFISHAFSATIASFYRQYMNSREDINATVFKFLAVPINDKPSNLPYSQKFEVLSYAFKYSWLIFSRALSSANLLSGLKRNVLISHIMSFGELSSHLMVLAVFLLAGISLEAFLFYEVALFIVLTGICTFSKKACN